MTHMNKIKILIADSSASLRQFIKYTIEDRFPHVVAEMANSGKNIQQRIEDGSYDLILYEKEMPMLDGNTLLGWIREHETLGATPFIMISSSGDAEDLKRAIHLGVDAYLLKPFKGEALISKVTFALSKLNRGKSASPYPLP
jgi:DNA-binding response OmpR family regulator